ncbi:MAG: NYN domain-containing protein [Bryobacteraceae bacterium]
MKIAVFIDFDNIEIGVKSTLQREFDVAAVLDALKERGEIVTKIAYANWGRQDSSTRQMAEHAVQMVQRDPSPRGDKNGADINLALDALELAFTHDHINAFAIVSGDSDFIALVNKLKQYNKLIFVVGGKAFTSTILQKNCHEFISYESLLVDTGRGSGGGGPRPQQHIPREQRTGHQQQPQQQHRRPAPLDLNQAMPLVERALQVLERREVRPQLGLLKSTMLQLDSTFNEKAYGASSFSEFVEKLKRGGLVNVTGGEGRYMITRKTDHPEKPAARPEDALPVLRDLLETHRIEIDDGVPVQSVVEWMSTEYPDYDWKAFGFQEFSELLNYAQDKLLVRIQPNEETGLTVFLGPEFHPPAVPDVPPEVLSDEQPKEEPQPVVIGQPAARGGKPKKPRKKASGDSVGNVEPKPKRPRRKIGVMQ